MVLNYSQEGIHNKTFELFFHTKELQATIKDLPSKALFEIDKFSYNAPCFQFLLSLCIKTPLLYSLADKIPRFHIGRPILFPNIHKKAGKGYYYSSKIEKFSFDLLENHLKEIVTDKGYRHDLKLNLAFGHHIGDCAESIPLSLDLPNSVLVSGTIPMKNGDNIRHYVIEIPYKNQVYIIDYASNLIIQKDDYYRLTHFQEIARMDQKKLEILYHFCGMQHFCNHTAIIGTIGNEIYDDLERNQIITKSKTMLNHKQITF